MLYAENTQVRSRLLSGHSATNEPKATFTIEVSKVLALTPTEVSASTLFPLDQFTCLPTGFDESSRCSDSWDDLST